MPGPVRITFLYAALLALLFVGLSVRTLLMRRSLRISIGDRGDEAMLRAMRVHSNFAEYVPLALLLFYFVELAGTRAAVVHGLGIALLAGRAAHAYGVSHVQENYRFRVAGMALTLGAIVTASIRLLGAVVSQGA
jgi:uncharacterized membrane protein YecN with MAPEG domain